MDQFTLLTDDEILRLKNTRNVQEWNAACSDIKKARGGEYPEDWWYKIMSSGLFTQIKQNWGQQ